MKKEHVDKRFKVDNEIEKSDLEFFDPREAPFSIHGVFYEDGCFHRMPAGVASTVSPNVLTLSTNTSGGRIRFRTNSKVIAISVKLANIYRSSHFTLVGSAGLDLYIKEDDGVEKYWDTFMPPYDMVDGYESRRILADGRMREIVINMPIYTDVEDILVGVERGAELLPAEPYPNKSPIVYYGNSITQGACATRPGNAFATQASRAIGYDFVNLGFSGSGRAEIEIAEYIAGLDMDIFVYDYDYNAPTAEYLAETHERMFRIIREKHPDLPVIMLSRTSLDRFGQNGARNAIIYATYENARASGDENVYYINGSDVFPDFADSATIEGCHSNDLGQTYIAIAIARIFREIIEKRKK